MSIIPISKVREVKGITKDEKQRITDFLQGAIYCWCKNRPNEWFAIRDLLGGDNYDWNETPLIALYDKYINKGKSHKYAVAEAGKDAGRLAKKVLSNDKRRKFETKIKRVRKYRWIK